MYIGKTLDVKYKEIEVDWKNAEQKTEVYAAFREALEITAGGYSSDSLIELITQPEHPQDRAILFTIKNCKRYFEINGYEDVVMSMMRYIVEDQIYDFDTDKLYPCSFNLQI